MSSMRNRVQLIGRLGTKPEIKEFEGGKIKASFRMATKDFYKNQKGENVEETTWHNVVAWDRSAETIQKYTDKGSEIAVDGKISNRSWEDKEGNKKYITEIVADSIMLLGERVAKMAE